MRGKYFLCAAIAVAMVGLLCGGALAHERHEKHPKKPPPKPNPFTLTADQRAQLRKAGPVLEEAWEDFWKSAKTTFTADELKSLRDSIKAQLALLKTAADWPAVFSVWDSVYALIDAAVTAKADATLSAKYATLKAAYDAVKLIIIPPPPAADPGTPPAA